MATESDGAKTILCLCNGNYCRSPIAEGLLRKQLEAHGHGMFRVTSAGTTRVHEGKPPASLTIQVIRQRAAPDFTHTPHHVTPDEVAQADLILAMAAEHRDWIAEHYPDARSRTMLLAEAIGQSFDIPDPGVDKMVTLEEIVDLIEQCVRDGVATIAACTQSRPV
jgi:protein-tyrosine phosphatase